MKELIIYKDEVNNEDIKDIIFKDGKISFEVSEEEQKLFKNVLEQDIMEIEPGIF
jgi:predicted AAA+ superfamily ATPase